MSPIERETVSVSPTKKWVRNSELKPQSSTIHQIWSKVSPKTRNQIQSNPIQSKVWRSTSCLLNWKWDDRIKMMASYPSSSIHFTCLRCPSGSPCISSASPFLKSFNSTIPGPYLKKVSPFLTHTDTHTHTHTLLYPYIINTLTSYLIYIYKC